MGGAKQLEKDEERSQEPIYSRIPDIEEAVSLFKEQHFYAFSERLTGMAALVSLISTLLIGVLLLADVQVGEMNWQTPATILFGVAGAPWIILIPIAVLITAFARAIQHINKEGKELRPDWDSPYKVGGEHIFRILGSVIILYFFTLF